MEKGGFHVLQDNMRILIANQKGQHVAEIGGLGGKWAPAAQVITAFLNGQLAGPQLAQALQRAGVSLPLERDPGGTNYFSRSGFKISGHHSREIVTSLNQATGNVTPTNQ